MATPRLQMEMSISDTVKAAVKTAQSFDKGLTCWRESLEAEMQNNGFEQAWVDHWRALKALHKHHVLAKHGTEKKAAKQLVYQAFGNVVAMHLKLAAPTAAGEASVANTAASPASASPPPAGVAPATSSPFAVHHTLTSAAPSVVVKDKTLKSVKEADGSTVEHHLAAEFHNWGYTVANKPYVTFVPKTRTGVCNLIKWANEHGKRVRGSGYRHTWTDLYSGDDQVLVSMLPLDQATHIPVLKSVKINDIPDGLQSIKVEGTFQEDGVTKARCRIGASTTNDMFRAWCLDEQGGKYNWTIPLNVIMVEITWGGSNAPICHGAGWKHTTLSDLVLAIEFVNAKGEIQIVDDPVQLKAAAGAFGLMGIVTAVTLKLDPMTYAAMHPEKTPVTLTIPPPRGVMIPSELDKGFSQKELDKAWATFVDHCENDYYAEWFWFPFQDECWVNCWKNNGDKKDSKNMGDLKVLAQNIQGMLGNVFNVTIGSLSPRLQTWVLAWSAMTLMPDLTDKPPAVTPLIEGLHFRRGIQNMRVVDMELEIPIPATADGKPDWSVCQKAWWAVITRVYKYRDDKGEYPLRIALEMRISADSQIIMAPQRGNKWGTCSIEILTTPQTDTELWNRFMQEISDEWNSYVDHEGYLLNTRSHWAKQWQQLQIDGMPAVDHYRTYAYKRQIHDFRKQLRSVAATGGYKLSDMQRSFSNQLLDYLFFHPKTPATAAIASPQPVAADKSTKSATSVSPKPAAVAASSPSAPASGKKSKKDKKDKKDKPSKSK